MRRSVRAFGTLTETPRRHSSRARAESAAFTDSPRLPENRAPHDPSPIVFGTDGWRGRIARDLTFDSVARVVDAMAAWTVDPANADPGDPWTLPIVHDTRFLSPELAAESAARLATKGFRVLLTDRPVPTPCASWHVKSRRPARRHRDHGLAQPARVERREVQVVVRRERHARDLRRHRARPPTARSPTGREAPSRRRTSGPPTATRSPRASTSTRSGAPACSVLFDADPRRGRDAPCRRSSARAIRRASRRSGPSANPSFGGVNPEPIPENLGASIEAPRAASASTSPSRATGTATVSASSTPTARFVTPHRILALLAESLARRGRIRGGIAKTFSTSLLLDRVAARLGVPLHVTPIGFKYIAEKMLAGEVGIGGEESGGLGVSFFLPERDGVLSALLVLEAIAHSGALLRRPPRAPGRRVRRLRLRPARPPPPDAGPPGVRGRASKRAPPSIARRRAGHRRRDARRREAPARRPRMDPPPPLGNGADPPRLRRARGRGRPSGVFSTRPSPRSNRGAADARGLRPGPVVESLA